MNYLRQLGVAITY